MTLHKKCNQKREKSFYCIFMCALSGKRIKEGKKLRNIAQNSELAS